MKMLLRLLSCLLMSGLVVGQNDYYCNTVQAETISGVSEGRIITREQGEANYRNSMNCVWKLDTGSDNNLIQLTVESVNLQWSPEYASCSGYDYMDILDGIFDDSVSLTTICHAHVPYNIISKGRYLYIKFTSTNQNFYNEKGIEIRFKTFNKYQCPPDWFQVSTNALDCFLIVHQGTTDYLGAQEICHLNRGNLASINSQAELTAILDHGRNISYPFSSAWLGLSDLMKEGTFAWVDRSSSNSILAISGKSYNTHCVSMDFSQGKGIVKDCKTKLNYICKAKKDGSSVLYPAKPTSAPPEEDHDGTQLFLIVILVVVFIILILVGIVLVYFCYYRKNGRCARQNSPASKRYETGTELSGVAFSSVDQTGGNHGGRNPAPASALPNDDILLHDPQMIAPPTYDESRHHPVAPANY